MNKKRSPKKVKLTTNFGKLYAAIIQAGRFQTSDLVEIGWSGAITWETLRNAPLKKLWETFVVIIMSWGDEDKE